MPKNYASLSKKKLQLNKPLDGLKVTVSHERFYGTKIVEYHGGLEEYDVNGILFCPMRNVKQMAMIRREPPVYV